MDPKQLKTLDFCIDTETLSNKANAAIINIACVPFSREETVQVEDVHPLNIFIHPMSSIILGCNVTEDTCNWWTKRTLEVQTYITTNIHSRGQSLAEAMADLKHYIEDMKAKFAPDRVRFWFQGKDFDVPILENAFFASGIITDKNHMPWKYTELRCARDYILEGVEDVFGIVDKPYDCLDKYENDRELPHTALYDATRSAYNVTQVYRLKHNLNE